VTGVPSIYELVAESIESLRTPPTSDSAQRSASALTAQSPAWISAAGTGRYTRRCAPRDDGRLGGWTPATFGANMLAQLTAG